MTSQSFSKSSSSVPMFVVVCLKPISLSENNLPSYGSILVKLIKMVDCCWLIPLCGDVRKYVNNQRDVVGLFWHTCTNITVVNKHK